jgi:hypothetical protein
LSQIWSEILRAKIKKKKNLEFVEVDFLSFSPNFGEKLKMETSLGMLLNGQ